MNENQFQFLNQMEFYYEIIQVMINHFYLDHYLINLIEVQLIHLIIFDYKNILF
jgi:hypothetical protein